MLKNVSTVPIQFLPHRDEINNFNYKIVYIFCFFLFRDRILICDGYLGTESYFSCYYGSGSVQMVSMRADSDPQHYFFLR